MAADGREICSAVCYIVLFVIVIVASFRALGDPVYHVAIDAVAGLEDLSSRATTVDPKFDLRVRIQPGLWGRGEACLELGSAVTVSYFHVPLATAAVPSRLCAAGQGHGRGAGTVSVVATGSGVRLPWDVQYALAWALWGWGFGPAAGTAEFDVTLTAPCQGRWKMVSCKTRVGDAAALYTNPCNATVVGTFQQAPLQVSAV